MAEFHPSDSDGRFLLDRNLRSPLWRQIAVALGREICRGRYLPGSKLPTEGELATWFGVNRHTIRRALFDLRERKLITVEQGRGTFVCDTMVDYPVSRRTRFSENLSRQNLAPKGTLIRSEIMEPDDEVSCALQVNRTQPVAALHILRESDDRPLSMSSHFFPLPRFAGIAQTFRETGSVTTCLSRHGVEDYFRHETRVIARHPTSEEMRLLGLPKKRPLLETKSINVDKHGIPVDYGIACYAGDRVQLVVKPT